MSFATPMFLWVFLPVVLVLVWTLPARWRNGVVALASLVFYTWGGGPFVLGLLACIVANFVGGLLVDTERGLGPRARRVALVTVVALDLGLLGVWKYAGFASRQVDALAELFGGSSPVITLGLPIGISFFTFHHISYVVDVYRGSKRAQRNLLTFVTYIAMFPQLIAGPIVRYHEIADQLHEVRKDRFADFAAGFPRFGMGLAKKVVVADTVAPVADAAFSGQPLTTTAAWVGVLAYTIQIYFDFSGYSDMAIGLARMLGFRFPENFARPYSAVSVTDFWRRWHMSLSRWFRDYVYIPLGGNRSGTGRTYLNLLTVFVLTGFWHGAAWTFLVWGLFHGMLLVVERLTGLGRREWSGLATVLPRAVTFLLVMVGWVFFRSGSMEQALEVLRVMVVPTGEGLSDVVAVSLTNQRVVVLALAALVVLMPRDLVLGRVLDTGRGVGAAAARAIASWVAAPAAGVLVAVGTLSPFLYFQF
ncbi:MBOAT family O-acyltransferase [Phycicoccus sonneratiae]|uniref:MBOAT family protein n=1 Tax=Phycicoccus sonneratiae TaxID=2807628 RepID=A0ABS2CM79_9MICO|nr:MBOAT family protein [Phycicoccus sonneraticus]MBM6400997.1 MBOAT family protein [Phycicoccus sonneraticus]